MKDTPPPAEKKRETTSVKVDPDVWKEVKHLAIDEDVEVQDFVDAALRNELKRRQDK
jgi:predicted transcriptional regulator